MVGFIEQKEVSKSRRKQSRNEEIEETEKGRKLVNQSIVRTTERTREENEGNVVERIKKTVKYRLLLELLIDRRSRRTRIEPPWRKMMR